MTTRPPFSWRFQPSGKHYFRFDGRVLFEVDTKYRLIEILGSGSYGVVCSSVDNETNEVVAIKKISDVFDNPTDALRTLRELMLLRQMRHANVITLKDVMMPANKRDFKDLYLVYELMQGDLHGVIRNPRPLSNDHCMCFMFQILTGLKYIHSANILHRDLKPGNILINRDSSIKICDFGLARTGCPEGEKMTDYVVTRWYRAPELLLLRDHYGPAVDIWSAGCILAEILGRKPLFRGNNALDQIKLIMGIIGVQSEDDLEFLDSARLKNYVMKLNAPVKVQFSSLYPHADPLAIDLLERMLKFHPAKRITAAEAVAHPYFAGFYEPTAFENLPAWQDAKIVDDDIEMSDIREMILKEIEHYHPAAC